MEQLKVAFRPAARADLSAIFSYIREASHSPKIAHAFIVRIRDRCERIGNAPHQGTRRDDLAPGLRIVPFAKNVVIAYRIEAGRVDITNVFYGGRDYEALYHGPHRDDDRRK